MSNWQKYPFPELQEAINWIEEQTRSVGVDTEVLTHCNILRNEIPRLIDVYYRWFGFQQYQDFIRPRNELAKDLFIKNYKVIESEDMWKDEMRRCLAAADLFLEVSGEKKKSKENIEEALRVVLGWEP